ncbi:MAG: sensor histidine kinase [Paracoccaceae bacterium]
MSAFDAAAVETLPPVLLASPREADRAVLTAAVKEAGFDARVLPTPDALGGRRDEAGALVVAQEALDTALLGAIDRALDEQPPWSELPIVLLTADSEQTRRLSERLSARWGAARLSYLARPVGRVELVSAIQLSLTLRLRQFNLRDRMVRERDLRHELDHRVKNILATVEAMATMTGRLDGTGVDAFTAFRKRLQSLNRVHAELHTLRGGPVDPAAVIELVLRPYDGSGRITVDCRMAAIDGEAARLFGMCLHELVTNAAKYGALSVPEGRIAVTLALDGEEARFVWHERDGPPVAPPTRVGYGTRFLQMTLNRLFGARPTIEHAPEGLHVAVAGRPALLIGQ